MYLHPQAQRYFYRLLRDLTDSGDCQVIYSTHSPVFADVAQFESIRLLRKEVGSMTTVTSVKDRAHSAFLSAQRDAQKMEALDASRSEVLFARKTLLVEGVGDKLAAQLVAEALGLDVDAEDLAIVSCGSKSAIPFFVQICQALAIPFVVLHDHDIYDERSFENKEKARKENTKAAAHNKQIAETVANDNLIFIMKPSLEGELAIGRNAKDKPKRIVQALKELDPAAVPSTLRKAVDKLFEELT
jgi:putative ATP-dependent endonuclease of the OLD family